MYPTKRPAIFKTFSMPTWARLLPMLAVVSASSLVSSTDRIIGIGVGTFIMAVTALAAVLACVGARGTLHWKYELRWSVLRASAC